MATKALANGTKVRRTDTGQVAYYVQAHPSGAHTVLPDTGPYASVVWGPETPMEVMAPGAPRWK